MRVRGLAHSVFLFGIFWCIPMLASMLQRGPSISYRWLAGWTMTWQARENGLLYARFNLCGYWHCWLSLSGLLLSAKVGSFRAWPLHDVLDLLTRIGDVYGSLASDLSSGLIPGPSVITPRD